MSTKSAVKAPFSCGNDTVLKGMKTVRQTASKRDQIKHSMKTTILTLAIMLTAPLTGAMAQTAWDPDHPRRDQVNDRLSNQNHRISREVREGELTKGQAQRLHAEDRAIRNEQRTMAGFNHGHITGVEQKALNQQENAVSRQIGK
jgi:hypothetical protein